jgi:D-proline reductase (dithiol) PrdB
LAELSELPFRLRAFMRLYRWRTLGAVPPWTSMTKRLTDANLSIVSTAGLVERSQAAFDPWVQGGDFSFRTISNDVDVNTLIDSHRSESFDHSGIRADANLAFPLDRLHELQRAGRIGAVNHRHWSFMGSITAPNRLIARTAPEAAQQAVDDHVDAVLLVPV